MSTGRHAEASLYSLTQTISSQFGDLVWAAFDAGDELQRGVAEFRFSAASLSFLSDQAYETLRVLLPDSLPLAILELCNKYEVYNLVKQVRNTLHIPAIGPFDPAALVDRADSLGQYPDLWAIEGLGHDYAESFWGGTEPPRGVLNGPLAASLPRKSLPMMHAGMGLSFAKRILPAITPYSPVSE
jgi:hypothetical protein